MMSTRDATLDDLDKVLGAWFFGCVFLNGFCLLGAVCMWMCTLAGVFLFVSLFFLAWTLTGLALLFFAFQVCLGYSENGLEGAVNSMKKISGSMIQFTSYWLKETFLWEAFRDLVGLDKEGDAYVVDEGPSPQSEKVDTSFQMQARYKQA